MVSFRRPLAGLDSGLHAVSLDEHHYHDRYHYHGHLLHQHLLMSTPAILYYSHWMPSLCFLCLVLN